MGATADPASIADCLRQLADLTDHDDTDVAIAVATSLADVLASFGGSLAGHVLNEVTTWMTQRVWRGRRFAGHLAFLRLTSVLGDPLVPRRRDDPDRAVPTLLLGAHRSQTFARQVSRAWHDGLTEGPSRPIGRSLASWAERVEKRPEFQPVFAWVLREAATDPRTATVVARAAHSWTDTVPRTATTVLAMLTGVASTTDGSPLIKQQLEAGTFGRLPLVDAQCAYVLSYRTGELRAFAYPPRPSERVGSVWCYIVDTSSRATSGTLKIPARGGAYSFETTYATQWRVVDPNQVVRGNVVNGEPTVSAFLRNRLRSIGGQFDPDDAAGVETQIHTILGAAAETHGLPVGDGLALTALTVQLTPDPKVTDRGVALDEEVHQGRLIERRAIRLRHLLDGDGAAIRYHLAQNPDDTNAILQMIVEARDRYERMRLEWLDRMRSDDAIQEADYEQARAAVLGASTAPPPAGSSGTRPNLTPPPIDRGPAGGGETSDDNEPQIINIWISEREHTPTVPLAARVNDQVIPPGL